MNLSTLSLFRVTVLGVLVILNIKETSLAQSTQAASPTPLSVSQTEISGSHQSSLSTQASNSPQSSVEIAILKAQLEVMRQYDQRLLNTVYWALGGIAGILILIVGLGWYTNFRLHKREVEELKVDYRREINDLKSQHKSFFEDLRTQYQEGLVKLEKELKPSLTKDIKAIVESKITYVGSEVKNLKLDLLVLQIEGHKKVDSEYGVLMGSMDAIELSFQIRDWFADELIDNLEEYLSKKTRSFSATTISEIHARLSKFPSNYTKAAEAIMLKLSASRA